MIAQTAGRVGSIWMLATHGVFEASALLLAIYEDQDQPVIELSSSEGGSG